VYAIIEDSGTQIKVRTGDIVELDPRQQEEGSEQAEAATDRIVFDRVLAIGGAGSLSIGRPYLAGASVSAEVLSEGRGDKVRVVKYKRRKGYRRAMGHRQPFLRVRIGEITPGT
jgi:large subunit ribosomal protein L21